MSFFRAQQTGDEDDASENSEEYQERQAVIQRNALARATGAAPADAKSMAESHELARRAKSDRIVRLRDSLAARAAECLAIHPRPVVWPPPPLTCFMLLPEHDSGEVAASNTPTRDQARRNATVRRLTDKLSRLHAATLAAPGNATLGALEQRRIATTAARPPWPAAVTGTIAGAGASTAPALTVQEATTHLEYLLGGMVAGIVRLPRTPAPCAAFLVDLRLESFMLALAVVFQMPANTPDDAFPAYWPRSQYMFTPADDPTAGQGRTVTLQYVHYYWVPFELATAAAAGTGAR